MVNRAVAVLLGSHATLLTPGHALAKIEAAVPRPLKAMSEEQLKAFLEKVKTDTSLQEKLKAASDPDAVAATAKEAGFMISADDLNRSRSEISEEELEHVSGGGCSPWTRESAGTFTCLV